MVTENNPRRTIRLICPICRKELRNFKHRPFCSIRCKEIDLERWMNGTYRFTNCSNNVKMPERRTKIKNSS